MIRAAAQASTHVALVVKSGSRTPVIPIVVPVAALAGMILVAVLVRLYSRFFGRKDSPINASTKASHGGNVRSDGYTADTSAQFQYEGVDGRTDPRT
ncbi:hypothetical protein H0H93_008076 [Arthromyces matolae]|nr:hypothetical protein H0H93_008076 [Arthromyces matolae]